MKKFSAEEVRNVAKGWLCRLCARDITNTGKSEAVEMLEAFASTLEAIKALGPIDNNRLFKNRASVNKEALKRLQEVSGVTCDEYI